MTNWQGDEALVELIDLYFRLSPAPTAASMKTWLAREIGSIPNQPTGEGGAYPTAAELAGTNLGKSQPRSFKPSDWMEPREVADYLKLSVKTLANWRSAETGPAFAKYGRVLYRKSDVDAWRETRLRRPDSGAH